MSGANLQHLLAMILYMAAVIGIGVYLPDVRIRTQSPIFLAGAVLARGSRHSAPKPPICPVTF